MKKALLISIFVFIVFLISGRGVHTYHHFFVPLAKAFLSGRVYVDQMQSELHEMIPEKEIQTGVYEELIDGSFGKYYVIYPPLPAVILMPFVALFSDQTNQSVVSMLVAAISVGLAYLVFKEIIDEKKAFLLSILYAFGSMLWYHSVIGSAWYFAQVCSLLFIWLAIWLTIKQRSIFLVGLSVGLAYLCRFPAILALPFFIIASGDLVLKNKRINWQAILKLASGFAIFFVISLIYNYVRYKTISHYGYTLLELRPYNIANEYSRGSYDLTYIARNLEAIFWSMPERIEGFPYLAPKSWAMSLWFVFPAIFITIFAPLRNKLTQASIVAILCILPSALFHGGVGTSQFGYRFALDFMPFMLILIALAIKSKINFWHILLISLSILVNLWGIWFTFWRS